MPVRSHGKVFHQWEETRISYVLQVLGGRESDYKQVRSKLLTNLLWLLLPLKWLFPSNCLQELWLVGNRLRIACGIFTLFHRRSTIFSMLDSTWPQSQQINIINSEQEMENGLKLFATFALRSIVTHHNQHFELNWVLRTHTPTGFLKLCCGVGKRHVIITIRVHSGVQSLIVFKSFLVRHFHGAINWMEVHKILNCVNLFIHQNEKRSFPYHINHPFFHEYHWVTLAKKHTSYIPPKNQRKNKKLCILKYLYIILIIVTLRAFCHQM